MAESADKKPYHMPSIRIIEIIIATAIIGLMNLYASSYVWNDRFEVISKQIEEIKISINQMRNDFYIPRFRKDQS